MIRNYIVGFLFVTINIDFGISGLSGSVNADDVVGLQSSNGDDTFRVNNSGGLKRRETH